eukprot:g4986.t1
MMRIPSNVSGRLQRYVSATSIRISTGEGERDVSLNGVSLNFVDNKDLELSFRRYKLRRDIGLYRNLYLLYTLTHFVFLGLTGYQEYQISTCDEACVTDHAVNEVTRKITSEINMKRTLSLCNATKYDGTKFEGAFWCTEISPLHPTVFFFSRSILLVSWLALFLLSRTNYVLYCDTFSSSSRWQYIATAVTMVSTMIHTQSFFVNYGFFDAVSRDSSANLVLPSGIEFVVNIIFMVFVTGLRHIFATLALFVASVHFGVVALLRENSMSVWLVTNLGLVIIALSWFIRVNEIHARRAYINRVRLSRNNLRNSLRVQPFTVRNLRGWLAPGDIDRNSERRTGSERERGRKPSSSSSSKHSFFASSFSRPNPNRRSSLAVSLLRDEEESNEYSEHCGALVAASKSARRILGRWIIDWNDLELQNKIGEGSSSVVWKGTYRGRVVAIKQSRDTINEDVLKELSAEASALFALKHHPHIVRLHGIARSATGRVSLVLEWCSSNVKELLEEHPINLETRTGFALFTKIAKSAASAMTFLHNARIVHRDIKPENLMLTAHGQLRVGDFGIARIFSTTFEEDGRGDMSPPKSRSPTSASGVGGGGGPMGTPAFMSPELFTAKFASSGDFASGARADVYAFGITLAAMLLPKGNVYPTLRSVTAVALHVRCGYRPLLPIACPHEIAKLVKSCWAHDPKARPSFTKICSSLEGFADDFGSPRRRRNSFGGSLKSTGDSISGPSNGERGRWLRTSLLTAGSLEGNVESNESTSILSTSLLLRSSEERRTRSRIDIRSVVSGDEDSLATLDRQSMFATTVVVDGELEIDNTSAETGPSTLSRAMHDFTSTASPSKTSEPALTADVATTKMAPRGDEGTPEEGHSA